MLQRLDSQSRRVEIKAIFLSLKKNEPLGRRLAYSSIGYDIDSVFCLLRHPFFACLCFMLFCRCC
jgi:hypothetical protein